MGAGFVRALRTRGEDVNVYNRNPEKAKALEADGAHAFANAADAVRGADVVHITLSDDASVDAVLDAAMPGLANGTTIVDHTTVAPKGVLARHERLTAAGYRFQHAPMFMGPQNAREHTGLMLASGPQDVFDAVKPLLEPMTGNVLYLGARVDKAAAFKLFGNMMLVTIFGGLADVYTLAKALDIDPVDAHTLFATFKPGNAIDARGAKMAKGDFAAAFELTMARKDVRLMIEEAERHGEELHLMPALAARMDAVIASGRGSDDVGVLAYDAVTKPAHA
jgi:3-hydroxyisobutyrate dehydrogenase